MVTPGGQRGGGGRVLARRYHLQRVLGRGAMGAVWEAEDTFLRRTVAVKEVVIPGSLSPEERAVSVERTMREARAIARLGHPNVVTLFDVLDEDARPWVVMELVPSRSLAEVIKEDGPLHPLRVATVGLAILGALEAAHAAGITHRDVKPGNILLGHDGRVKLTDFGIARAVGDDTITGTGLLVGSPSYIAPEIIKGQEAGAPADLWGLGATLYASVEGRAPFSGGDAMETLSKVVQDPPTPYVRAGSLVPALNSMLDKDPTTRARPVDARRMLLDVLRGGGSAPARPAATPDPAPPPPPSPGPRLSDLLVPVWRQNPAPDPGPGPVRPAAAAAAAGASAVAVRNTEPAPGPDGSPAAAAPLGGATRHLPVTDAVEDEPVREAAGRPVDERAGEFPDRGAAGARVEDGTPAAAAGPGPGDQAVRDAAGTGAPGTGAGRPAGAAAADDATVLAAVVAPGPDGTADRALPEPTAGGSVAGSPAGERGREALADDDSLVDPDVLDPDLIVDDDLDGSTRTDLGLPDAPTKAVPVVPAEGTDRPTRPAGDGPDRAGTPAAAAGGASAAGGAPADGGASAGGTAGGGATAAGTAESGSAVARAAALGAAAVGAVAAGRGLFQARRNATDESTDVAADRPGDTAAPATDAPATGRPGRAGTTPGGPATGDTAPGDMATGGPETGRPGGGAGTDHTDTDHTGTDGTRRPTGPDGRPGGATAFVAGTDRAADSGRATGAGDRPRGADLFATGTDRRPGATDPGTDAGAADTRAPDTRAPDTRAADTRAADIRTADTADGPAGVDADATAVHRFDPTELAGAGPARPERRPGTDRPPVEVDESERTVTLPKPPAYGTYGGRRSPDPDSELPTQMIAPLPFGGPSGTQEQPVRAFPARPPAPAPMGVRERPTDDRRKRTAGALLVVLLLLVAVVLGGFLLVRGLRGGGEDPTGAGTGSGAPSAPADATVPAGSTTYTGPDFSVAVPAGWPAQAQRPGVVDVREPNTTRFLRLITVESTAGALGQLETAERQFANDPSYQDYRRVRLETVDYRGLDAAEWEFTFTLDGVSRHVLYRGVVAEGKTYGLYLSTPQDRWAETRPVLQVAADTFRTTR